MNTNELKENYLYCLLTINETNFDLMIFKYIRIEGEKYIFKNLNANQEQQLSLKAIDELFLAPDIVHIKYYQQRLKEKSELMIKYDFALKEIKDVYNTINDLLVQFKEKTPEEFI